MDFVWLLLVLVNVKSESGTHTKLIFHFHFLQQGKKRRRGSRRFVSREAVSSESLFSLLSVSAFLVEKQKWNIRHRFLVKELLWQLMLGTLAFFLLVHWLVFPLAVRCLLVFSQMRMFQLAHYRGDLFTPKMFTSSPVSTSLS